MEYKTITIDGEKFLLVPKPKEESLDKKYKIRFEKSYIEKHFDVEVFGWSRKYVNSEAVDCWVRFRRTEKENGNFQWWDWSTGGIHARSEIALLLEKWYQEYQKVVRELSGSGTD